MFSGLENAAVVIIPPEELNGNGHGEQSTLPQWLN
jgi:hypothetical protein